MTLREQIRRKLCELVFDDGEPAKKINKTVDEILALIEAEMIPFPNKKYQIIYADPPWELKAGSPNLHAKKQGNRELLYPTMTIEQIKLLPILSLVNDNAVLFLWTTNKYIEQSYSIARAWGFTPSTMLVWCKKPKGRGLGGTFGISTEFLLFCRRGSLKAKERYWSTWFEHKRGKHSEKPQMVRDIIKKCFAGEAIELFARQKTEGWDVWGNEVESDIQLPTP